MGHPVVSTPNFQNIFNQEKIQLKYQIPMHFVMKTTPKKHIIFNRKWWKLNGVLLENIVFSKISVER